MPRTTDQTATDDPVLSVIAKRKAEALARAEKEHTQLAAAARLYTQGTKTVNDAEEALKKGRDKQDSAIASMMAVGLDSASVAETLGITTKAVADAVKRHRAATGEAEPARKGPGRPPKAKPAEAAADQPAPANGADTPSGRGRNASAATAKPADETAAGGSAESDAGDDDVAAEAAAS
jgi:hypothetical protein